MAEMVRLVCAVAGGGFFPGDQASVGVELAESYVASGAWREVNPAADGRALVAMGVEPRRARRAAELGAGTPALLAALDTVSLHKADRVVIDEIRAQLAEPPPEPEPKPKPRTVSIGGGKP